MQRNSSDFDSINMETNIRIRDLSVEYYNRSVLITNRTIGSRLWFVNNKKLENEILGYLAKYVQVYEVVLEAFTVMGNHYHLIGKFPKGNRSDFVRSFNSIVARLTSKYVKNFKDGKLWARRSKVHVFDSPDDVEKWFYYVILNPIYTGLVKTMEEYELYSSFLDVVYNRVKKFKIVNWTKYLNYKRSNKKAKVSDFEEEYELKYSIIEAYEKFDLVKRIQVIKEKARKIIEEIERERMEEGKGFLGKKKLRKIRPGSRPRKTKSSFIPGKKTIILTQSPEVKNAFLKFYYSIIEKYYDAVIRLKKGFVDVVFPEGCHRSGSKIKKC